MNEFSGLFWSLCLLLTIVAASFVVLPLWRTRRLALTSDEAARDQANIALFHERGRELEAEFAAGELDEEQLAALRLELQSSLLSDVAGGNQSDAAAAEKLSWRSTAVLAPLGLSLLLPIAAWLMYQQWGQLDEVALMDQFQRSVTQGSDPEVAGELVLSLGQAVRDDPDRPWAWYFLGENLSTVGMFDVANSAYRQAAERMVEDEEKALALGRVALTAYILEQLELGPAVRELIDQTLALNPDEPNVLQLLAGEAEESGDHDAAIGYWRRLAQLNPDSRMARQSIARLQSLRAGGETPGPAIEVAVAIGGGLTPDPQLRVFISARNAEVDGMPPLAVAELRVADLPADLRLDDSLAVGPFKLSSADSVFVSALVSRSGTANRAAGDYYAESEAFPLENPPAPIELVIIDRVP